jgi:hypothetical protein
MSNQDWMDPVVRRSEGQSVECDSFVDRPHGELGEDPNATADERRIGSYNHSSI